jgi:WD40 repeat protein
VIVGCGDGSISVFEGQRNGAQTCRTYQRGSAEACTITLDGGVTALVLRAADDRSGEIKLLAGTSHARVYAVQLSMADFRAISAPPAECRMLTEGHYDAVTCVAYPPDSSEYFATASADGTVRMWDVNTYEVTCMGSCQTRITGKPTCLTFTGDVIFTGWEDGKIRAHEAENGQELWAIDHCHVDGVTSLTSSRNKKFLVSGGEHGEVRVWEIRTREMIVNLKQHTSAVTSLCLFADDSHVVSGSRDRTIYLWDLQTESRKASLTQRMGGISAVILLPDHVQLATVGQEKSLTFWDLREPEPLKSMPCGTEFLAIAQYSPPRPSNADPSADACAGDGRCAASPHLQRHYHRQSLRVHLRLGHLVLLQQTKNRAEMAQIHAQEALYLQEIEAPYTQALQHLDEASLKASLYPLTLPTLVYEAPLVND